MGSQVLCNCWHDQALKLGAWIENNIEELTAYINIINNDAKNLMEKTNLTGGEL